MQSLKILFLICLFGNTQLSAEEINKNREYLHSYGIAHCLSKSKTYQAEANLAMGGYFQLGNHSIEAQNKVKDFIEQKFIENLDGYKDTDMPAYIMRCLEISYTDEYQEFILKTLKDSA